MRQKCRIYNNKSSNKDQTKKITISISKKNIISRAKISSKAIYKTRAKAIGKKVG